MHSERTMSEWWVCCILVRKYSGSFLCTRLRFLFYSLFTCFRKTSMQCFRARPSHFILFHTLYAHSVSKSYVYVYYYHTVYWLLRAYFVILGKFTVYAYVQCIVSFAGKNLYGNLYGPYSYIFLYWTYVYII